jgi:hypothetical protein
MGSSTGSKINQLLRRWPNGTVAVSSWLEKQGAYQQLVQKYEATAWLRRVGQGAYAWQPIRSVDRRSVCSPGPTAAADPRRRKNRAANARVCPFLADGKRHTCVAVRTSRREAAHGVQAIPLGRQGSLYDDQSFFRPSGSRIDQKRAGAVFDQRVHTRTRHDGSPVRGSASGLYEEARLHGGLTVRPRIVQSLLEKCVGKGEATLHASGKLQASLDRKVDLSKVDSERKAPLVKGGRFDPTTSQSATETTGTAPSAILKDSPYLSKPN